MMVRAAVIAAVMAGCASSDETGPPDGERLIVDLTCAQPFDGLTTPYSMAVPYGLAYTWDHTWETPGRTSVTFTATLNGTAFASATATNIEYQIVGRDESKGEPGYREAHIDLTLEP